MRLWVYLVPLVVSLSASLAFHHTEDFENTEEFDRDERSLFTTWRLVMFGARPCGFCANRISRKVYKKAGGLDQAKKDFDMLDPTDIKVHFDGAKTGYVGNRLIHLEPREIPSLYVSGRKATLNQEKNKGTEIFYFNRMPDEDNRNWKDVLF